MGVTSRKPSCQQIMASSSPAGHLSRTSTAKRKRSTDEKTSVTSTSAKRTRRKEGSHVTASTNSVEVIDLTGDSPVAGPHKIVKSAKAKQSPDAGKSERRARVFRKHPPQTFLQRLNRATTQRMFVLGYTVTGADDVPEMSFDIAGTTGNIYKTVIGKEPTCSCPDARKGNQCKHICYVLVNVLKAPQHLQYQLAFLSMELREIYEGTTLSRNLTKSESDNGGQRKSVEGDCPICFMEFKPEKEDIVWCQAACGNNIHKTCFQQWAVTQRSQGVRCVYCRSPWQTDTKDLNLEQLTAQGHLTSDGYINVADQLGLSGLRGTRPSLLFDISSSLGLPTIVSLWFA
ncbi:RING finger protein [Aspergillus alliaceus]|uniref:RING finger protein n=1 Tax=Petromyces alliaceus TaxID=209559 RepID=UPI0012A76890|nr:uncharacterized protein BDW43DRAFT_291056 [Aspergillus alliaceus]KAB8228462.1 hypothetical protein BDW43DRAFT_291056 [Aspergillus alliaceus]